MKEWRLRRYPDGVPCSGDFELLESPPPPAPDVGEVTLAPLFYSMDPLLRVRLNPHNGKLPPIGLGDVMAGRAVGRVVHSAADGWLPGDCAVAETGWRELAVLAADGLTRVDPALGPLSTALGVLGPSGVAAYAALFELGEPTAGNTVLVPAAAGSVGSVVCQLAALEGCKVIAVAGGAAEVDYLRSELGIETVLDWQSVDFADALGAAAHAAGGIDVFIDLVGGAIHDQVMRHINIGARVALVGYISAYNAEGEPENYGDIYAVLFRRATVRGFFAPDFAPKAPVIRARLGELLRRGELRYHEEVTEGFERLPEAFASLFSGFRPGKKLVRAGRDDGEAVGAAPAPETPHGA